MTQKSKNWSQREIDLAVNIYVAIILAEDAEEKFNKAAAYREASAETGRSAKSYEFRLLNLSSWLNDHGYRVANGLVPGAGTHIGANVEEMIKKGFEVRFYSPVIEKAFYKGTQLEKYDLEELKSSWVYKAEVDKVEDDKYYKKASDEAEVERLEATIDKTPDIRARIRDLKKDLGVQDQPKVVEYWMKDDPSKSTRSFDSLPEAQAFMSGLDINPNCEAYGLAKQCYLKEDWATS